MKKQTDLANAQRGPLLKLLNELLDLVDSAEDEIQCKNDREEWTAESWKETAPYCGCLRCDIVLVEKYFYRVRGGDYERLEPQQAIHSGTMAVLDYIAASRGCSRPFHLKGIQAHVDQCSKCRAARSKRHGRAVKDPDKRIAHEQVARFIHRRAERGEGRVRISALSLD